MKKNKILGLKSKKKLICNFENKLDNIQNNLDNQFFLLNNRMKNIESMNDNIQSRMKNIESMNDNIQSRMKNIESMNNNIQSRIDSEFNYVNLEMLLLQQFGGTENSKKVLICGYYGAPNLGDELMLETLMHHLNSIGNFDITIMLCDNNHVDVTKYKNCNFIHYPTKTTDFNLLAKFYDCIIFGGGALIDDIGYDNITSPMTLGKILINLTIKFIQFNKTTILYGLSSNRELSNSEFIEKLDFIVNNATHFSLRDTNSLETLKKCNIDSKNIKIVDDVILSNKKMLSKCIETKKTKDKKFNLGIIYICSDETIDNLVLYTNQIIKEIEKTKKDYKINFIPFYAYYDNDINYYYKIKDKINNNKISVIKFSDNLENLIDVLNQQDAIVSMRYHGTLISNILNKKVLSIDYDIHRHYMNKLDYIYDHYKFPANRCLYSTGLKEQNIKKLLDSNEEYIDYNKVILKANKEILKNLKLI